MNEETIYLLCVLSVIIPLMYIIMFGIKYLYISTLCREWNRKLYHYTVHLENKKKSENYKHQTEYLERMYLYPDEIGIYVFRNWKESDLIFDKFTLFNVNQYWEKSKRHGKNK